MLVQLIGFPGTFIIACVICAAVGFRHSRLCLLPFELHQTPTTILVYLYRLQLKSCIDKYFLMVLRHCSTCIFYSSISKYCCSCPQVVLWSFVSTWRKWSKSWTVFFPCKGSPILLFPHDINIEGFCPLSSMRNSCFGDPPVCLFHCANGFWFYFHSKCGAFGICRTRQSPLNCQTRLKQVKLLQRKVNPRPGNHICIMLSPF